MYTLIYSLVSPGLGKYVISDSSATIGDSRKSL